MPVTFVPPVPPSAPATDKPEIKILQAAFGDGYSQPTPDGINHIRSVLTLRFDLLEVAQKNAILAFLEARKGTEAFFYTLAGSTTPKLFTCQEWESTAQGADLWSVSATFRQSFQAAA